MSHYALPSVVDSGLSHYIEQVSRFPMLSEEREFMLAKRLTEHQDTEAAHQLVTSHLRLVVKIAMGYRGYNLPVTDIIAEGNIGLMQAVKKFDPDKGFRLSTYAMWWIRASIQEYVLKSWSLVKIGTTAAQKKLFFNLKRMKNNIQNVESGNLTPDQISEIANELDVSERDVVSMEGRMFGADQSLHRTVGGEDDGGVEAIDLLADNSENQEEIVGEVEQYNYRFALFQEAMQSLNEREQEIVKARRLTEPAKTLDDLSQRFDVSKERIRQIENRAMEKLEAAVQEAVAS